jgi:hypothetical protein
MYLGFQLGLIAIATCFVAPQYIFATWAVWLVSVSLTFSPLWFNPITFQPAAALDDWAAWQAWMQGATMPAPALSWCVCVLG